jgi:hypothetical protein
VSVQTAKGRRSNRRFDERVLRCTCGFLASVLEGDRDFLANCLWMERTSTEGLRSRRTTQSVHWYDISVIMTDYIRATDT